MAKLSYAQAIRQVIAEEMRRDERVFVMGEDVEKLGGVFGTTRDLYKEFGTDRIRNTPISESPSWVPRWARHPPACVP